MRTAVCVLQKPYQYYLRYLHSRISPRDDQVTWRSQCVTPRSGATLLKQRHAAAAALF